MPNISEKEILSIFRETNDVILFTDPRDWENAKENYCHHIPVDIFDE